MSNLKFLHCLWKCFQANQLQMVLATPLFSTAFSALCKHPCIYVSFHFVLFTFYCPLKQQYAIYSKFFFYYTWFVFLDRIIWSVCMSGSQIIVCLKTRTDSRLCVYHLIAWSNLNILHNSHWITFSTQLCLVLYYFCNSFQYSLIMWLTVSSLSSHNLRSLFDCQFLVTVYCIR